MFLDSGGKDICVCVSVFVLKMFVCQSQWEDVCVAVCVSVLVVIMFERMSVLEMRIFGCMSVFIDSSVFLQTLADLRYAFYPDQ